MVITHCWLNVGPLSSKLAQHSSSIGLNIMFIVSVSAKPPPPPPLTFPPICNNAHNMCATFYKHGWMNNTVSLQLIHTPLLIFNDDFIQVCLWNVFCFTTVGLSEHDILVECIGIIKMRWRNITRHHWLHILFQILDVQASECPYCWDKTRLSDLNDA